MQMIWSSSLSSAREDWGSYALMLSFGAPDMKTKAMDSTSPPLSKVGLRIYRTIESDFMTVILNYRTS